MANSTKIKIIGAGGHGIKLLSHVLAEIVAERGQEATLNLDYDAAVRGGNVGAEITISEGHVTNPFIEQPDILIMLAPSKESIDDVPHVILDAACAVNKPDEHIETYNFPELANQIGNIRVLNMIVLGRILKLLGIDKSSIDFSQYITKALDLNLQAIDTGYNLQS
jgi:Pyruvate/2-oxoacid:ferredoxin oxidoreductase gamma subunit